jgi:hypothetical protein
MTAMDDGRQYEYIVEFTQIGRSIKVTAMDPKSLLEASIVGPANVSNEMLASQAIRKLEYVLSKVRRESKPSG